MGLLDDVSFVKRGKNRLRVLNGIKENIMPSELVITLYGKQSNTYFNIVSRALGELEEAKIVKVVNPESRTGRLYSLTNNGKKVLKEINKQ